MRVGDQPLVSTIKEKCRMCYTCVRECPAKAIQVSGGQAQVLSERCIGCGNCILVCAMKAKLVYDSTAKVRELLSRGKPVAVIVAPSYPAEFADLPAERLVGALRRLGFASVHEVSFGADLVAREYARLLAATDDRYIATTCPAVVAYVEKYVPELTPSLCPVVSPMIATARVVRALRGGPVSVVFVGPCVAKKGEAESGEFRGEVEAVLTFRELRAMFEAAGIDPEKEPGGQFDPPRGGAGGLFPVSRGLLQAAGLAEDLMRGDLVVADEQGGMWRTIREFQRDPGEVRLLEVLSCHGCVMGPGFTHEETVFTRQRRVARNLQRQLASVDPHIHARDLKRWRKVALSRGFQAADQQLEQPSEDEMKGLLLRMGKQGPQDELNCGACGYLTCRDHSVAVFRRLAEPEMCLPFTIEQLRTTVSKLEQSHEDLSAAREALTQSERLASMGQIAAGIAHEVNNPLGVVLIYANLLLERLDGHDDYRSDLSAIAEHADRCKKIVAGLLNFARQNKVFRQSVDVRDLVAKSVTAARLKPSVRVQTLMEVQQPVIEVDPDQMIQVLSNLFSNADAAMPEGGCLTVRIHGSGDEVSFDVSDTGGGIAPQNLRKVFEPFFTTKQVGRGTGLGLAIVHGIVKMHGGRIEVRSNADPASGPTGTTFNVTIPRGEDPGDAPALESGEEAGEGGMNGPESPLRVLVVDDEEALGVGVRRILEPFRVATSDAHAEAALEVRIAKSGEEALETLKDFPADLVLLDYKLPGMNGIEVLRHLSRNGGGPMVIMITAYASLETAVKATKMGSYDFLAKPFTPEELRYAVRKAAEHILLRRHAEKLAAEKRRIRFEFLSVLAHELKSPLDAVEGYLDILVEKVPGQPAQMLGRCQERILGMKKMILDLLDLTRIESGQKNRDLKRLDLVAVLRRGVETQLPRAGKKEVRIEVDAPPALDFTADEGEMDMICNNLLSNAVKYNKPGGKVSVALRRDAEGVELKVVDTGIGIAEADQGKLFKEFVRIRNSTTAGIPGSGLGLSTVRKLAMLYGGDVKIESRAGQGSAFTVRLRDAVPAPAPGAKV